MATHFNEEIHTKNKHLTFDDRIALGNCLQRAMNLTDTAKYLHCSIATVKKEIDRNKELKINQRYRNLCGLKRQCERHHVCGNMNCIHLCSRCINSCTNCNEHCKEFTLNPHCKKLKHLCGVCNGCDSFKDCKLNKWLYSPNTAYAKYLTNLSQGHKGVRLTKEEAIKFSHFLKPRLEKNLSLDVIKSQFPEQFPYSIQSVYNWVNNRVLPGIDNIMLPRKVRYTKRKSTNKEVLYSRSYLENRYYSDFISYITDHPYEEVIEMDSVEGKNHSSYIMTLLFRRSNFMLAFKLKDHTSNRIIEVFDWIKEQLGTDVFKQTFPIILTDRGSEFSNPNGIEMDKDTNELLTHVFYCDSRQSQQKGKIEKNHEELRKIFPKGFDFNSITQDELNKALSHINSYPRKLLNYKSPYDLFSKYTNPNVLNLNKSTKISLNELNLTPSLIRK